MVRRYCHCYPYKEIVSSHFFLTLVKGPCLVLVIEWQFRWTNKYLCWDTQVISPHKDTSMSNMCHAGEMAKGWCYAHIVWSRSSLHMRHDMKLCDQNGEDQNKTCLDGPVAMEKGKSRFWSDGPRGGEAWARLGADGPRQLWRAGKVKIDGPKRSCDDFTRGNNVGHFISPV